MPESQQKSPRPALPRIEDFPIRVPDTIRFADMDRQGHVNNAIYPTYFETGRVLQIYDPKDGLQVDGCTTVLARIEIDFLKELRWPGTVEIGTATTRIGPLRTPQHRYDVLGSDSSATLRPGHPGSDPI